MEDFRASVSDFKPATTFAIGSTFGIFLTLGNAWAEFLKEAVAYLLPQDETDSLLDALVYALAASVVCIIILFGIVYCETLVNRCVGRVSVPRIPSYNIDITAHRREPRKIDMKKEDTKTAGEKKKKYRSRRDIYKGRM